MTRYVLDTDTAVDVLRGRADVIRRLSHVSPDHVAVTSITVAELRYRMSSTGEPERNWLEVSRLLGELRVLPFGLKAAERHAEVRRTSRLMGHNDLMIAATVLAAEATLVTSRASEFGRVSGLKVETWRENQGTAYESRLVTRASR